MCYVNSVFYDVNAHTGTSTFGHRITQRRGDRHELAGSSEYTDLEKVFDPAQARGIGKCGMYVPNEPNTVKFGRQ